MTTTFERAKKQIRGRNKICISFGQKIRGKCRAILLTASSGRNQRGINFKDRARKVAPLMQVLSGSRNRQQGSRWKIEFGVRRKMRSRCKHTYRVQIGVDMVCWLREDDCQLESLPPILKAA
jgi:hypothetical protein